MSLFSTLLVKLRLHTKKRRRESGKQPTTGSQSKTTPVPVATEKVHEWCEWMKLKFSQVSANRITLRMIPNGEVHNLTNPIQATEKRSCELCEWSRSNVQVFLLKRTVFLQTKEPVPQSQKMRATEPEPNSHIKRKGITKKGGTKQIKKFHIQGGDKPIETSHKGRMLEFEFFVTRCFQRIASLRRITTTEPIICILYFYLLIFIANESARICCTNV